MKSMSAVGLLLAFASVAFCDHKPMVTVYYESLCTDSIRFVTKQLFPSFNSPMRSHFDLKLVPFGKAKLVGGHDKTTWTFQCHHGERECYGNKVHGCALERIPDLNANLNFIVCLMEKTLEDKNAPYPVQQCAEKNRINPSEIIRCANETAGVEVLKKYQEETDKFMMPLASVPTVAFNEKYDKQTQEMAVDNFALALCKHLDHPPKECTNVNAAGANGVALWSLVPLAIARFLFW